MAREDRRARADARRAERNMERATRRGMRGAFDDERFRRGDTNDDDDLIMVGFYIVLAIGVLMGVAGWLDSQFGWGLVEWMKDLVSSK